MKSETMMHRLLKRQLKRLGLDEATPPTAEVWQQFLERVSRAYTEADQDRELLAQRAAELEETTTFLNSIIDNIPTGVFVKEAENLSFVEWNKANEAVTGLNKEEVMGKNDYDFFPEEEAEFFIAKDREVLAGGTLVDIPEEPIQTAHRGIRLLHTRKMPILGTDEKPKYLLGISEDITERKQTEEAMAKRTRELSCLNDIGREMEETPSIPELLQSVTERIPPAMQYPELCQVAIDFDEQVYGVPEAIELPNQMTHGLYIGGEVMGRVYIAYTEKHDFLNEESALLGGVATRLSGYIENRRLFEQTRDALAEQERLAVQLDSQRNTLQAVLQSIPAGVFVAEVPSGKSLLANQRAEAMLGRGISPEAGPEELAEVYAAYRYGSDELYPQSEMPLVRGMFGEISSVDDMEIRRPDGSRVLIQVFGAPIKDASGEVTASVAIFQDITERKQTEEAMAKRTRELSCLNDLGREIGETPPVPQLLQWVTERIPPAMRYPDLCAVAIKYEEQVYGRPEAIEWPTQIVHALRIGGEVMGRIYISYREKHDFLDEESALLGGVANRVSGYIESQHLFGQIRRQAERERLVNAITQKIQGTTTVESALQTAIQELGQAFQARYTRVELATNGESQGKRPANGPNGTTGQK